METIKKALTKECLYFWWEGVGCISAYATMDYVRQRLSVKGVRTTEVGGSLTTPQTKPKALTMECLYFWWEGVDSNHRSH